MSVTDLQRALMSSPLDTGNDSSQPDMTDMVELSGIAREDTCPGTSGYMDIDTETDGPGGIFNSERNTEPSVSHDHLSLGPLDPMDVSQEAQYSDRFAPASIFGAQNDNAPDGKADSVPLKGCPSLSDLNVGAETARDSEVLEFNHSHVGHMSNDSSHVHLAHTSIEDTLEEYVYHNVDHDIDSPMVEEEDDAADDFDENLDESGLVMKRWDFRPSASVLKRGFTSTWRDQDDSGNYDPKADRQLQAARKFRKRVSSRHRGKIVSPETGGSDCTADEVSRDQQPESTTGLAVLRFANDKCIDSFRNMLTGLKAQQTTRRRCHHPQKQSQNGIPETANLPVDIKNKPIARCCWSCAETYGEGAAVVVDGKADCSLVTNPTQWPCLACVEVGVPCRLIIEPLRKLACEDCKRQRTACSFSSTRNHAGPCQQCKTMGQACVAGPVKDAIVPRLEYKLAEQGGIPLLGEHGQLTYTCDAVVKKNSGKKRCPAVCVECSETDLHCDYGDEWGACHECKRTGQACTIPNRKPTISSGSPVIEPSERGAHIPAEASLPNEMPLCESQDRSAGPKGTLRTILTSFSHPISFNCDDDEPSGSCHLCDSPALQIVGFDKKMASVIDFEDSSGFVEVSGGHGANLEPTALCTECTTSRLSVIMCARHEMGPIPNTSYTAQDEERALDSLLDGNLEGVVMGDFCSICPSLATLKCNADQEDGPHGCGLSLCERCTAMLVGRYYGELGKMLAHEKGTAAEGEGFGLRADAELLESDGVLVRYLTCLSRE